MHCWHQHSIVATATIPPTHYNFSQCGHSTITIEGGWPHLVLHPINRLVQVSSSSHMIRGLLVMNNNMNQFPWICSERSIPFLFNVLFSANNLILFHRNVSVLSIQQWVSQLSEWMNAPMQAIAWINAYKDEVRFYVPPIFHVLLDTSIFLFNALLSHLDHHWYTSSRWNLETPLPISWCKQQHQWVWYYKVRFSNCFFIAHIYKKICYNPPVHIIIQY